MLTLLAIMPFTLPATVLRDTLTTTQNDKIILTYELSQYGTQVTVRLDQPPRITPGDALRKECKGDLSRLKVVIFDRIGDFGQVKWRGMAPAAFMVPAGLSYEKSSDGYFIAGQSPATLKFNKRQSSAVNLAIPVHIAVADKKQTYRLVRSTSRQLNIKTGLTGATSVAYTTPQAVADQAPDASDEDEEDESDEIAKAQASINMVTVMLAAETEVPFSQSLQMEIFNLRAIKDRINDQSTISAINNVLLQCNEKERILKDEMKMQASAAQAQQDSLLAQQKAQEEARLKDAEDKARRQEEESQTRTMWFIIGGVILTILALVGNATIKHFRDVRNQKNIMQMQQSIAKQASNEASRRSTEIVRNTAHKAINQGKSKVRGTVTGAAKPKKNTKIKSI